ncbi:MAG: hypothetical protein C0621_09100 [Desulfuromonas sp.]|nr:MAG: hypothetical protein C0621_09100 [Desulfuromonas sp.]
MFSLPPFSLDPQPVAVLAAGATFSHVGMLSFFLLAIVAILLVSVFRCRQTERRLQIYRKFVDSSDQGMGVAALNGDILFMNSALRQLLGLAGPDSESERRVAEFYPETLRPFLVETVLPQVRSGKSWRGELELLASTGEVIPTEQTVFAIADEQGRPSLLANIVVDIRERRRIDEALRDSEAKYHRLFSAERDAIVVIDAKSDAIVEVNEAAERLYGWEDEGWKEIAFSELFVDVGVATTLREDLLSQDENALRIVEHRRADGSRVTTDLSLSSFIWRGRPMLVAIVRDVSARTSVEQLKDEMLSSVSHEMRTPLTAMFGFTEFMIKNELERPQQLEYLDIVYREGERLRDLIDNLLNLQRLRAGFSEIQNPQPVAVLPLLHEVTSLFCRAEESPQLQIAAPGDLPVLMGDEEKLLQALKNYVSNALKYAPQESIVILGAQQDDEVLDLYVDDAGPGIPTTDREKIFKRFYRLDRESGQRIGGTGLGLALVREVARVHGGVAGVERSSRGGSRFYLRLPLSTDVPVVREKLPPPPSGTC